MCQAPVGQLKTAQNLLAPAWQTVQASTALISAAISFAELRRPIAGAQGADARRSCSVGNQRRSFLASGSAHPDAGGVARLTLRFFAVAKNLIEHDRETPDR